MPQKTLPYTNPMQDGRRKIPASQHPKIRTYYNQVKSQRKTAAHFSVSRRLIVWILFPERLKQFQQARYKKKVWLKYYDTEKQKIYQRAHRAKKRKLHLISGTPKQNFQYAKA